MLSRFGVQRAGRGDEGREHRGRARDRRARRRISAPARASTSSASSIGDARSLQGGTLLPTSLRGPNGEIVALAQGPLSIGGFGGGSGGTSVQVNHLTVGRIPGGAIVQATAPDAVADAATLTFALREPGLRHRVARRAGHQRAPRRRSRRASIDPGSVVVQVPAQVQGRRARTDGASSRRCRSRPTSSRASSSTSARARSSSAATCSSARRRSRTAICRSASRRATQASQPLPYSARRDGRRAEPAGRRARGHGQARSRCRKARRSTPSPSALNALGASPRDIIAIMQALKAAGALRAEIVIL